MCAVPSEKDVYFNTRPKISNSNLIVEDGERRLLPGVAVVDEGDVAPHPPHVAEVHQRSVESYTGTLPTTR